MALDPRKKQKQVERRKAKDKARHEEHKRQVRLQAAREQALIAVSPILHCQMSGDLWEQGIGQVLVSRELPDGRVALASFLPDVFCLGVKNAMYKLLSRAEYNDIHRRLQDHYDLRTVEPAYARKLVEGSIAYAADLGFPPHADYAKAKLLLESIDATACAEYMQFGKDGKPFYFRGPSEDRARAYAIMAQLNKRCGEGNFTVAISIEDLDSSEYEVVDR